MNPVDLGIGALGALALISIAAGLGMLLVFRRCSDWAAILRAKNLLIAHLLELALFLDEPVLVLRAQGHVIIQGLRLIWLILPAAAILTVPMIFLLAQLDAVFGKAPLVPGEASIVTAQIANGTAEPLLEPGDGFTVETPPMRVLAERQVSWRFRPSRSGSSLLRFRDRSDLVTKTVVSGAGMHYLSQRRTASIGEFLLDATELPIPAGDIRWIEVAYPKATVFGLHWSLWFFTISGATALFTAMGHPTWKRRQNGAPRNNLRQGSDSVFKSHFAS